ncbi:hypothetical protein CK203_098252 [Vitis vinifera]|uniref:Uncharacterized protein n=1 Tax=Vitis vinifera TaxID=29760 RepID=A0A438DHP9_VITVI|nr:hypothetical protein CK203_098252 [Vitis vinifera]
MALSSAFRERLEQMEHSRNQRLSLLQAEKDLQANKSQVLAAKFANIRAMERRCLVLEQKIASQNFKISATRSEIESLVSKYNLDLQQLRVLKSEVCELEELENEKERFYGLKESEMKEFNAQVERFVLECRKQVEELRNRLNEGHRSMDKSYSRDNRLIFPRAHIDGKVCHLDVGFLPPGTVTFFQLKLRFMDPQGKNRYLDNFQIAAAEMRKSELLAEKENLDRSLATNYQIRAQLQKQLQNILIMQNQKRMKLTQFPDRSSNSKS